MSIYTLNADLVSRITFRSFVQSIITGDTSSSLHVGPLLLPLNALLKNTSCSVFEYSIDTALDWLASAFAVPDLVLLLLWLSQAAGRYTSCRAEMGNISLFWRMEIRLVLCVTHIVVGVM